MYVHLPVLGMLICVLLSHQIVDIVCMCSAFLFVIFLFIVVVIIIVVVGGGGYELYAGYLQLYI